MCVRDQSEMQLSMGNEVKLWRRRHFNNLETTNRHPGVDSYLRTCAE